MFWNKKKKQDQNMKEQDHNPDDDIKGKAISTDILVLLLSESKDIIFNHITVNHDKNVKLTVTFVDGMVNSIQMENDILKPLVQEDALGMVQDEKELINKIMLGSVYHSQRAFCDNLVDCIDKLLSGSVLLVFDDTNAAIAFETKGFDKRGITEPTNENVLKGSKESFIEVLHVNTALVRRRVQTYDLKMHHFTLGRRTKTVVCVVYLEKLANPGIVAEIKKRISGLSLGGVVSIGQIENVLRSKKYSVFPQILNTEKVDKFCSGILEGRVRIIVDGVPNTLITPVDISSMMQASEDYASNFIASSFSRLLRFFATFISLTLPAAYISVTSFHQEMIPSELASSIIESKQGVPFSTFIEVVMMLLAFEVLLEAGLRLPMAVGQAVSIVGALVIGEAAITANILSPGVVIIIATAGITGFVIPSQDMSNAIRLIRMVLVFFSVLGGLFGVSIGLILLLYHLCSIEIFGVPYLSPFVSTEGKGMFDDTIVRRKWDTLNKRPENISPRDPVSQGDRNV
ncbi:MAG TPA: spore germination protein [Clostridiales bacterium]|nr:spore germination protein [Clostridiales bacterium]